MNTHFKKFLNVTIIMALVLQPFSSALAMVRPSDQKEENFSSLPLKRGEEEVSTFSQETHLPSRETTRQDADENIEQDIEELEKAFFPATNFNTLTDEEQLSRLDSALIFPEELNNLFNKIPSFHKFMHLSPSIRLINAFLKFCPEAIYIKDEKGMTLLHHALNSNITIERIRFLLEKGSHVDELTGEKNSPLDIAATHQNIPAFIALRERGATLIRPKLRLKFYESLPSDSSASLSVFNLLKDNQELDWYFSLSYLFPKQEIGISIKTTTFGERKLPNCVYSDSFDSKGNIKKVNTTGSHLVGKLTMKIHGEERSFFVKQYPELPGLEEAVGSLVRRLFGSGTPYTELIRIGERPFLLSQEIKGKTLREFLAEDPDNLFLLDPRSTSSLILATMLYNPEDGKPDNYIVVDVSSPDSKRYKVVSIDNDHAFVPGVAKEQKPTFFKAEPLIQVRSFLYCLDQMTQPVHPEIRTRFLEINSGDLLEDWLQELKIKNKRYKNLFPDQKERTDLFEKQQSYIGIPFPEGTIQALYQKVIRLQNFLRDNKSLTHLQLLSHVEPGLAYRYKITHKGKMSPQDRFDLLDKPFYKKDKDGAHYITTSSGKLLQSMGIPFKKSLTDDAKSYGPDKALEELRLLKNEDVSTLMKSIHSNTAISFNSIKSLQLEDNLSLILKEINFKNVPEPIQIKVIEILKRRPFQHLNLVDAIALNDQFFLEEANYEKLLTLNLMSSSGLTDKIIPSLVQKAIGLRSLNLSFIPGMRKIASGGFFSESAWMFPHLEEFYISHCPNLETMKIQAPQLQELKADHCKLSSLEVMAPCLTSLDIGGNKELSDEGYKVISSSLRSVNLQGCAKLTFIDALTQHPYLPCVLLKKEGLREKNILEVLANKKTTELDLYRKNLGQEEVKTITHFFTGLRSLKLGHNNTGDRGAKEIADNCPRLTLLNLQKNNIGDEGAKNIASLTSLESLHLGENHIGDSGVQAIQAHLSKLVYLNLEDNRIGPNGKTVLENWKKSNSAIRIYYAISINKSH